MSLLHNAYKTSVWQRKLFAFLVVSFFLTSSKVQAAELPQVTQVVSQEVASPVIPGDTLSAVTKKMELAEEVKPIATLRSTMTAYSSTPDETDDSPFVTATGACVRDGIVASNFLAFGTKLRIPQLFGDKVFEVQDRMNARYASRIDIWMKRAQDGREFGIKRNVRVEILERGDGKKHWDEGWTNKECAELST